MKKFTDAMFTTMFATIMIGSIITICAEETHCADNSTYLVSAFAGLGLLIGALGVLFSVITMEDVAKES